MEIASTQAPSREVGMVDGTAESPVVEGVIADFETLLRRHQAMVFSIAKYYLGDAGRAEDVAQEVFLQLHGELAHFQSEEHVAAWLRRVVVHRSIDALRGFARTRTAGLDTAGELRAPPQEEDILLCEKLRRLVASLPEQQRISVILRYQEDLGPSEIAEILGMRLATVKSHLRRALLGLREKAERLPGFRDAKRQDSKAGNWK